MSICEDRFGSLPRAALGAWLLVALTACGGADCLRKSDCDSAFECREGICVAAGGKAPTPPAAGAGGASAGRAGGGSGGALTAGRGGAGGSSAGAAGRGGRGGASGSASETGGLDAGGTSDMP